METPIKEKEPEFELTPEIKRNLGDAWSEMVVDTEIPENIEEFDEEELKEWLFNSVMDGVENFVEKEGISADESLIEKIKEENNLEKKAALEIEYIKSLQESIGVYFEDVRERNQRTKWNSWPKLMEEKKSFNCAGSALIGIHFLEKAGIKSKAGFPVGHVVNVVELSNGEVVYGDLATPNSVHKIDPEIKEVNGVDMYDFEYENINYQRMSVFEKEMLTSSILGNLSSINKHSKKEDDSENTKRAKEYKSRYSKQFEKVSFRELDDHLFENYFSFDRGEEMKEERERIKKLFSQED